MSASEAIARLRELRAKATAGEWRPNRFNHKHEIKADGNVMGFVRKLPDAEAIVAAMNSLPKLLDAVDALIHIEEYWNGSRTDGAMSDALDEITATARNALDALSKDTP